MLMHKLGKSQVDYGIGMKESHCGKAFAGDTGYCRQQFLSFLNRLAAQTRGGYAHNDMVSF
jgi:hypothetical protein